MLAPKLFTVLALSVPVVLGNTLLEVLRANGASDFARQLEAFPQYLGAGIGTVFAPLDTFTSNGTLARRQDSTREIDGQVSEDTTALGNTPAAQKRAVDKGDPNVGAVVRTESLGPKQEAGKDNVVVEVLPVPSAVKRKRTWHGHSSSWAIAATAVAQASGTTAATAIAQASSTAAAAAQASDTTEPIAGIVPRVPLKVASGLGERVNVLRVDIPYHHGVVHLVDNWFTSPIAVSATLQAKGLTSYQAAIAQNNQTAPLDDLSNVTIFVPTNQAFAALGNSSGSLASILSASVVPNFSGYLPRLRNGATHVTLAGGLITVSVRGGKYYVNDAEIISANIITDNGVIHVIDKVLLPGPVVATTNSAWSLKNGVTMGAGLGCVTAGLVLSWMW